MELMQVLQALAQSEFLIKVDQSSQDMPTRYVSHLSLLFVVYDSTLN